MTILIFNRRIAGKYINIRNEESFFEYYEVIKYYWADQIYHEAFQALLDLIIPTVFDHIVILKCDSLFLYYHF